MAFFRPISNQIEEVDEFFRKRYVLLIATFILTALVTKINPAQPPQSIWSLVNIAAGYLLVLFLLFLVIIKMFGEIFQEDRFMKSASAFLQFVREVNYCMLIILILLLQFGLSFAAEYFIPYAKIISTTVGLTIGSILALFLMMLSFAAPIFFTRYILTKADLETNKLDKMAWHLIGWFIMGVAIPGGAFLWRREPQDLLIMPVLTTTICGWLVLADLLSQKWFGKRLGGQNTRQTKKGAQKEKQ